ncbi:Gamma-glutamylputrescine oxidoreductase PuuB [Burkholderiales bacterium]|nr:Gamma-glutamylputrescine oxidoreductase PuuB [Burkholderiales bacterium]
MLASEDHLTRNSYYLATAAADLHFAPLEGAGSCDVCIVGAGLAGLSAAIDLRRAGLDVVVLEGMQVGWGASGRNGGQALSGLACDMSVVRGQLGREAARVIWDMTVEAVQLIHERRREFAIDCQWHNGFIAAAIGARKARELRAWVEELERDYGYGGMRLIESAKVRQWIDSARYQALAYDPRGGHLHPLLYTQALARVAAGLGARIHEGSRALRLERGALPIVYTARGAMRCRHVLLAGNVYLEDLAREVSNRIMPVGTFIAASARLDAERARALIPSGASVCDTQFVLEYFRLSADDRMLFGGRVSYSTVAPLHLAAAMRRRMVNVFPQLHDVPVEYSWGGFVDITMNRAPDFGRIDPNIYYVQGFSGHGLALSGLAGRLAAEAIRGSSARFDVFARMRHHDFPGGRLLRTPALILATAWYRLRDVMG